MKRIAEIKNQTIIISALDWGFGHTTRCTQIIKQLQSNKNDITIAGNRSQIDYFEKEFNNIKTVYLKGYNIKLNSKYSTYLQILIQTPKILNSIIKEFVWLKKYIKQFPSNYIISDNRYGLFNKRIKSIIITHQITPQIPVGKKLLTFYIKNRINNFDECWIPDEENFNLSGNLASQKLKISKHYIGLLNRFKFKTKATLIYDYLFLVSGPKPESNIFLEKIEHFILKHPQYKICLVSTIKPSIRKANIQTFTKPTTSELNHALNSAKIIVGKSGYTSLMELYPILNKTILIPTKGQYEQEYLSNLNNTFQLIERHQELKSII